MSPWWREEITAQLAPAEVVLVRRSRGLRRRELERKRWTPGDKSAKAQPDIVAVMRAGLASKNWRNGTLRVTLRGALVRYLSLPRVEKLSQRDALVYAQQSFVEVYGETARNWTVCVDATAHGGPGIAAAADLELIEALRTSARELRLQLSSVRPALCAAVDNLACVDRKFSGWLAVVDTDHSCIARLKEGECLSVRTARFSEPAEVHLLTQLQQDALCAGVEPAGGKLYICASSPFDHACLQAQGWLASPLPSGSVR